MRGHPRLGQRDLGPLEHGANGHSELAFAVVAVIQAGAMGFLGPFELVGIRGAAMMTKGTFGSSHCLKGFAGLVLVLKHGVLVRRARIQSLENALSLPLRAECEHRIDHPVDVRARGPVIDDRGADRELAADRGRRRRGDPGFVQVGDDLGVERVGIAR